MVNINDDTPQLQAARRVLDAYASRDLNGSESVFSKDFRFQSFPKTTDHVEESKWGHFESYGGKMASYARMENIIHEVIEAPGRVILHVTAVWSKVDGGAVEYDTLLILSFVKEGGELKVLEIKDFSDPEKRNAFHVEASKALAKGSFVAA